MWQLEPGVAAVFNSLANLPAEVAQIQTAAGSVGTASIGGIIASIFGVPGFLSFAPQLSDLNSLQDSAQNILASLSTTLSDAQNIQELVNYDPLEKLMRDPVSFFLPFQQGSGIALRFAMVALEDGAMRYVNEANTMIERDGKVTPVPPPPTAAQIAALKAEKAKLEDEISDWQNFGGGPGAGPVQKPRPGLAHLMQQLAQINAKLAVDSIPTT